MRRFAINATSLLVGLLLPSISTFARDLTFEERVKAQEAIERVYYSHQIGTTKPFEDAVPRAVLENRVRTYLKESVALDEIWHAPITGTALNRELSRIASGSRMPERLREIYSVLGNDSFLVQECLVRPMLVSRLARGFFAWDIRFHDSSRMRAEALRAEIQTGELEPWADRPERMVITIPIAYGQPRRVQRFEEASPSETKGEKIADDPEQSVIRLVEERDAFVVKVLLDADDDGERWALYRFSKGPWEAWWGANSGHFDERSVSSVATDLEPIPAPMPTSSASGPDCVPGDVWDNKSLDDLPTGRRFHTAIWTGSELIVWGGDENSNTYTNTGARYDPATDTWRLTSAVNAPDARAFHSAVWTGNEMIVWGGYLTGGTPVPVDTGGRYDPATDTWATMSSESAPERRGSHTATWTGTEMLVWGGSNAQSNVNTGGRYDPVHDTWRAIAPTGAPSARSGHAAVWTGRQLIIWGGVGTTYLNSGGRYDPATDSWTPTALPNAPDGRSGPVTIWTGNSLLIWAGRSFGDRTLRSGGQYDPESDSWRAIAQTQSPLPHQSYAGVWTGNRVLVWGGDALLGVAQGEGGIYDPVSDVWTRMSSLNSPATRNSASAVWTGDSMIVWGGRGDSMTNTGGRYNPASDSWTPVAPTHAPDRRTLHSATWTGNRMMIWGGRNASGIILGDGGQYDPALDAWIPVSTTNAPPPRAGHAAIWTGQEILLWGGSFSSGQSYNVGPGYDPATDTWRPVASAGAPARGSAIWTGSRMLVWDVDNRLGAQYDPNIDRWTGISSLNSPAPRAPAIVAWIGDAMVVWGVNSFPGVNTGGVYNPVSDTWASMSTVNGPSPRTQATAVWNGQDLLVWGGTEPGTGATRTGSRYNPRLNAWTRMTVTDAPEPRSGHTALWTGRAMLVWGGAGQSFKLDSGGLYDPTLDRWTPTSRNNASAPRSGHTAVWTGRSMIVWGGSGVDTFKSGGQYFPDPILPPPSVDAGVDQLVECTGGDGTTLVLHGRATGCDALTYEWTGPFLEGDGVIQGSDVSVTLPLGQHQVVLKVDDAHGQNATDMVMLRVQDTTAPTITCADAPAAECTGPSGSLVSVAATAADACSPHVRIMNSQVGEGADATAVYALGMTPVTFSAIDTSGNTATCTTSVNVQDTTPPALTVVPDVASLWPPNHELVPVHLSWQALDICDAKPFVTLLSGRSSEPDDAPGIGDGSTTGDLTGGDVGAADGEVYLRAERAGSGPGRVYELTYRAIDASGNAAPALASVTVPHDQGHGPEPLLMRLEPNGTPGMVRIYWPATPYAVGYDVISGDLSHVRVENGQLALGSVNVLARGTTRTSLSEGDAAAIPSPGTAIFFFIQPRTDRGGAGYGTESAPWPRVPESCDGGCP